MANSIEITGGVVDTTSRLWLKREMERFGEVDVCHMGNRSNPVEEDGRGHIPFKLGFHDSDRSLPGSASTSPLQRNKRWQRSRLDRCSWTA